ncbi:phycobilisome rod-core linker polypeptide [Leptothoe spongobia]|uniref:Phycobilisome rod-core linker polypeptide n=1 Tax=Leptothoe spongobia TAU-MAC 1115 TaxID=1967444 RepID=A0A947GMH6_9CYAN|nr:phycobilisome rod-core linker polypeptide [Leptothoe spongobia]MBT9315551.1 phycobilisome rod-core linker polypeptide [Leptothoe spongobia TAU-MAC 1115]
MQTLANNNQVIPISMNGGLRLENGDASGIKTFSVMDKADCLQAVYRRLFKDNRNIDFHHNASLDSAYLNGEITTQELVRELLCSDMFVNYILATNSNYRFVQLCFERVLGRPAIQSEVFKWSSLLASEGIRSFADKLTGSDEYVAAFGPYQVPGRRSIKLSPSDQDLPALPKELSSKRYQGEGNENQFNFVGAANPLWEGNMPPAIIRKIGAVLTVAGVIEVTRLLLTVALGAITAGHM